MATLAQMFGAVSYPPPGSGVTMIRFRESDTPPIRRMIDGEEDGKMQRMIELQEALLMQEAIGK